MSKEAINYYYSQLGLPTDYWQVYYSFDSVSDYVPAESGGFLDKSGIMPAGTVTSLNGSGVFDGNAVLEVSNSTGDLTNWTIMFKFSKFFPSEGTIFSNLSDGSVYSGFSIGVNNRNRLFIESYDENGPVVLTCNTILGGESLVAISKAGNGIYCDYFNANTQELESVKFEVSQKAFLNSSPWFVGGINLFNYPPYLNSNLYRGYLDDFIILNEAIRPDEIKQIFKGYYSDMVSGLPVVNTGQLYSLGMDSISYLNPVTTGDHQSLWYSQRTSETYTNLDAVYDRTVGEFAADYHISDSGVIGYMNGLLLLPASGYSVSGGFYNPVYHFSGNYLPSGQQFYANNYYQDIDRIVYDVMGTSLGNSMVNFYNFSKPTASSSTRPTIYNSGQVMLFFNGLKLVPGIHYNLLSPTTLQFPTGANVYGGATGVLSFVNMESGYKPVYEGSVKNTFGKFSRGTSLFWLNGVRQNLGDDYFETASGDFLNGPSQEPLDSQRIFTNEFTFLN